MTVHGIVFIVNKCSVIFQIKLGDELLCPVRGIPIKKKLKRRFCFVLFSNSRSQSTTDCIFLLVDRIEKIVKRILVDQFFVELEKLCRY